ncbi:hypothetical protein PsorP6_009959 [Peronosclerospora sorghi]|uniref:Uncharacterized protein n=1 Tax=Peronosclerospora sorghi TaxID=230839 RepID=A0ACC0VV54_9STRA|nr:hypothetical protein PsorP6_009959 [Peronosclerospora sorghi]
MEVTEKQQLLQGQADSAVRQMKSVREEMSRIKRDLETTQGNYERALQLHAAEVSKSSAYRREMELLRTSLHDREAEIETLNTKTQSMEKEAQCLRQKLLKGMESHASQEAGEGSSGSDAHAKEVDEVQSVIAYLRRENEIAEAKLELAQQEVQHGRAEIVSLKSSVERLRGEMKALNKAETLTKQLGEKNKEIDDRTSAISSLEIKLSSVQAQIHTVTTEKAALETMLTACETGKKECLAAASGVTASWEKERQTLKTQLELETKKATQLKDFNARFMSGLKSLNKENSHLKDQNAANAAQPIAQEKTPVSSPSPSLLVSSSTTTMTTSATLPTKSATLVPLFASPKTEPPEQPSSAGSVKATGSKPGIAMSVAAAISFSQTGPVATIVTSTTSTATTTTESSVLSTAPPAFAAPVQVLPATAHSAPVAAHSTEAQPKQVIENPTETDGMTAEEKLRFFALRSIKKQVGSAPR